MVAYAIAFVAMMTVYGEAFQHSTLRLRLLLVHNVQYLQYAVSCKSVAVLDMFVGPTNSCQRRIKTVTDHATCAVALYMGHQHYC